MRPIFYLAHKYLALIFTLPLIVLSVTGIVMTLKPKNNFTLASSTSSVALPEIIKTVQRDHPNGSLTRINVTPDILQMYLKADDLFLLSIDRKSGRLIQNVKVMSDPFYVAKMVHESFLLSKLGKIIVAICGLGLSLVLVSGLLYWSKSKLGLPRGLKLKDIHLLLGIVFFIPLVFASSVGMMIELNTLFWSDEKFKSHEPPLSCSLEEQTAILSKNMIKKGRINFCRKDYPYLTVIDEKGSSVFTPSGELVQKVSRNDWGKTFYFRKHFFVHLHSGHDFGLFKTPYRLLVGLSLFSLSMTGLLLWWKKRKRHLFFKNQFDTSPTITSTKVSL